MMHHDSVFYSLPHYFILLSFFHIILQLASLMCYTQLLVCLVTAHLLPVEALAARLMHTADRWFVFQLLCMLFQAK